MKNFQGKKVLISGAGKGIGKAMLLAFAQEGAEVYFFDKDSSRVEEVKKDLPEARIVSEVLDASESDQVKSFLKKVGSVDILVNNIGVGLVKRFSETSPQDLQNVFSTNFFASFFITQKIAKNMKNHSSIIFITSIHAEHPSLDPSYDSTKAATNSLVANLALELSPRGIRVNAIAPGHIDVETTGSPRVQKDVPLGKQAGLPKDVAQLALFLSDNELSGYITGAVIPVTGGLHIPIAKDIEF